MEPVLRADAQGQAQEQDVRTHSRTNTGVQTDWRVRAGEAGVLQGSSSWGRSGEAVSTVGITAATTVKSQSPESNHCKSSTIWIGKTGQCDEK